MSNNGSKRSGFRFTLTGFLPADANVRGSVAGAEDVLDEIEAKLDAYGVMALSTKRHYYQSTVVIDTAPELPLVDTEVREDNPETSKGDAATVVEKGATPPSDLEAPGAGRTTTGAGGAPLDIPAGTAMDRRTKRTA